MAEVESSSSEGDEEGQHDVQHCRGRPIQKQGYYLKDWHHVDLAFPGFIKMRVYIRTRDAAFTATPLLQLQDADYKELFLTMYPEKRRRHYRPCQMGTQLMLLLRTRFNTLDEVASFPLYKLFNEVVLLLLIQE